MKKERKGRWEKNCTQTPQWQQALRTRERRVTITTAAAAQSPSIGDQRAAGHCLGAAGVVSSAMFVANKTVYLK